MRNNKKSMSLKDDLILFYNKYLNIGLEENYLLDLAKRCANLWKQKFTGLETVKEMKIKDFSFTEQDYASLSKTDHEFLNFYPISYIHMNEDYDILIDEFGNIRRIFFKQDLDIAEKQDLLKYINQSIFSLLHELPESIEQHNALNEAGNIILQNILSSKIYKAILEKIEEEEQDAEKKILMTSLFACSNIEILSYDARIREELDYESELNTKFVHSRSLR